ncbi:uncharacterized protein J8A68_005359 [[Candida] subhashii]|uniref:Bromo domain-containing protein n=1 Tax=[Candida] subhashii TaxID=561895 RepID=A0A8J5QCW5_9ASCO|nr:uncharacterized protein J8A68_005359 [[Candida] subhashii]KAG7661122.1 hypothetical protein J8A68_005359 [[Candida] subhashii]
MSSEPIKVNPDLSIILLGSAINKVVSKYNQQIKDDCKIGISLEEFLLILNKQSKDYITTFNNNDINFPDIDSKLLLFIVSKTLYHKFVTISNNNNEVIIDISPPIYENIMKNIVATSTLRYSKYLLKHARDAYNKEKQQQQQEIVEQTMEVESEEEEIKPAENVVEDRQQQEAKNDVDEDMEIDKESIGSEETPKQSQESTPAKETEKEENKQLPTVHEEKNEVDKETDKLPQAIKEIDISEEQEEDDDEKNETKPGSTPESIGDVSSEQTSTEIETKETKNETIEEQDVAKVDSVDHIQEDNKEDKEEDVKNDIVEDEDEGHGDSDKAEESVQEIASLEEGQSVPEENPESDTEMKEEDKEEKSIKDKNEQVEPKENDNIQEQEKEEEEEESIRETRKSDSRKRSRSPASTPGPSQHKRFQNIGVSLITAIQEHRFSSPFLHAVNKKDAPDYYDVIYEPKDLKNMLKAVKSKLDPPVYQSIKELERDIMLMFANCVMYNKSDDDLVQLTRSMKNEMTTIFKIFEEAEEEIR